MATNYLGFCGFLEYLVILSSNIFSNFELLSDLLRMTNMLVLSAF